MTLFSFSLLTSSFLLLLLDFHIGVSGENLYKAWISDCHSTASMDIGSHGKIYGYAGLKLNLNDSLWLWAPFFFFFLQS